MDRTLEPAAVVGLGTMGAGIACVLAGLGSEVRVCDTSEESTERSLDTLALRIEDQIDAGVLDSSARTAVKLLIPVSDPAEAVQGAGLVIEAVFEDWTVKESVLGNISAAAPRTCVIASNTSSFSIERLAGFVTHPERFLGIHFFNPAEWIPGVEVIPCSATDETIVSDVISLLRRAGKMPARVRDSPGFIANRLQFALFREAVRCVDEGVATPEDIDTVVQSTFGFRLPAFGPFAIADMAGLDVYVNILGTLHEGLGDQFDVPGTLQRLVDDGHIGLKSGAGFEQYSREDAEHLVLHRARAYSALASVMGGLASDYD